MKDKIIYYLLGFSGSARERVRLLKVHYNIELKEKTIRNYCNSLVALGFMQKRRERKACAPKRTFDGRYVHYQGYYNYFPIKKGIEERKNLKIRLNL